MLSSEDSSNPAALLNNSEPVIPHPHPEGGSDSEDDSTVWSSRVVLQENRRNSSTNVDAREVVAGKQYGRTLTT